MRKKILIVTINDYILYQPTILNLYDHLSEYFDVEIVSFEPRYITTKKDESRNVRYLRPNKFVVKIIQKIDDINNKIVGLVQKWLPEVKYHYLYYNKYIPGILYKNIRKMKADIVIAVDVPALVTAQKVFGAVHFLSLEIDKSDPFYRKIDMGKILSVFIQRRDRYDYLFPTQKLPCFFVQNAPDFKGKPSSTIQRDGFIWAGTLLERFGVLDCIAFFEKRQQYKLTLKGGSDKSTIKKIHERFDALLKSRTLVIDDRYLPGNQFIEYLSGFSIGFCFYDWALINTSFNYRSAPSGKLFMYMAAGVPVIACNIPGFDFVKKFGAGVLIDDYNADTIDAAVQQIKSDYNKYSNACYEVAAHYSFDTNVAPYISYLINSA